MSRSRSLTPTIPWDDPPAMSAAAHDYLLNQIISLIDSLNYQYYNNSDYSYALSPVQNPIPTYVPSCPSAAPPSQTIQCYPLYYPIPPPYQFPHPTSNIFT